MSDALQGLCVLVVDDEPNIRSTIHQALARTGVVPVTASNAQEAYDLLAEQEVDVVLLDLRLPDQHGLEVIDQLTKERPDLAVIAFSAHASPEVAADAVRRGAADFLAKPFEPEQMRQTLRRATAPTSTVAVTPQEYAEDVPEGVDPSLPIVVSLTHPETVPALLRIASAIAQDFESSEIVALCAVEVPRQMSLRQATQTDDASLAWQSRVMDTVKKWAPELAVGVRTKTLWTHDAGQVILDFMDDEQVAHIVMEWNPDAAEESMVSLTDVQRIARDTRSEVTLVRSALPFEPRQVAAIVREHAGSAAAVRRAWALVRQAGIGHLTVLHARKPSSDDPDEDEAAGHEFIGRVLHEANLPSDKVDPVVYVDERPRDAIFRALEAFDTICLGASSRSGVAQYLFGSLAEEVQDAYSGTVLAVQGPKYGSRTVIDKIIGPIT